MEENLINEILEENRRRLDAINSPFDPISGLNSPGPRFHLHLEDGEPSHLWLPESMREEELTKWLIAGRSMEKAARLSGLSLQEFERSFMRLRALHDFPFWAARFVMVKRKGGGADCPFVLNRPQRRLVEEFERRRLADEPIRIILLKARQWGGSTCSQLYMAWLQLMHSVGLNSLIIAHQGVGSDEIKDMFLRMMENYPEWMLEMEPKGKKMENVGRTGMMFRVMSRNCKVKIGSAERPNSCRGGDYNLVHLSEVGIWKTTAGKSPEDIVRSACGGVLLRPMTMIVYESTANGTGNFFHREYMAASRGESQFSPVFVSWWEIDQYSTPLSADEERSLAERLVAGRESDFEGERSESGRYLWRLLQMGATLEAIAWYVSERAKYRDHSDMAAEYPSDDIEAFAHSGCRVFDRYLVEAMRKDCCHAPWRGEIESSNGISGVASLRDLSFHPLEHGGMEIWAMPDRPGEIADRYLAVVDVGGRSMKADWSVVTVFDRAPLLEGERIEVAAQWRGHIDSDLLAWRAARIARFYNDALLVVESNTLETQEAQRMIDPGQMPYILLQIRDAYPNLYERSVAADSLREGIATKLGFHTNVATKPMVIASLLRAVRDHLLTERSEDALDELLSYERRRNGSYGAIIGAHDDMLMTRAIGIHISLHEMPQPRLRQPRQSYSPSGTPFSTPFSTPLSTPRRSRNAQTSFLNF